LTEDLRQAVEAAGGVIYVAPEAGAQAATGGGPDGWEPYDQSRHRAVCRELQAGIVASDLAAFMVENPGIQFIRVLNAPTSQHYLNIRLVRFEGQEAVAVRGLASRNAHSVYIYNRQYFVTALQNSGDSALRTIGRMHRQSSQTPGLLGSARYNTTQAASQRMGWTGFC
jgi:hypothetical protein